jgi:hypothetical protein
VHCLAGANEGPAIALGRAFRLAAVRRPTPDSENRPFPVSGPRIPISGRRPPSAVLAVPSRPVPSCLSTFWWISPPLARKLCTSLHAQSSMLQTVKFGSKSIKKGDCSKATGKIRGNDCWTSANSAQGQHCRALWAGPQWGRRVFAPVVRRNLLAPHGLRRSCPVSMLQSPKRRRFPSKRHQKGAHFVMPILTFWGWTPSGASARAVLAFRKGKKACFGGAKWRPEKLSTNGRPSGEA